MEEIDTLKALCLEVSDENAAYLSHIIASLEEYVPTLRLSILDAARLGYDILSVEPSVWRKALYRTGTLLKESDTLWSALDKALMNIGIPRRYEWLLIKGYTDSQPHTLWCVRPQGDLIQETISTLFSRAPSFKGETVYLLRANHPYHYSIPNKENVDQGILIDIHDTSLSLPQPMATLQVGQSLINIPVDYIFVPLHDVVEL